MFTLTRSNLTTITQPLQRLALLALAATGIGAAITAAPLILAGLALAYTARRLYATLDAAAILRWLRWLHSHIHLAYLLRFLLAVATLVGALALTITIVTVAGPLIVAAVSAALPALVKLIACITLIVTFAQATRPKGA